MKLRTMLKTRRKDLLLFYALTAADILMILGFFIAIGILIFTYIL